MALHEYMLSEAPHRPLAVLLKERRFHPGDRISGKVRVTTSEPLNAYCIFVLLRGTEEASAGFHAVGGTMHEQNFSIFLHHRQYVVPPQEPPADKPLTDLRRFDASIFARFSSLLMDSATLSLIRLSDVIPLARGAHLFDFSLDLPKQIPASFRLDSWAAVRYTITAYLQLAGKPASEAEYSEAAEISIIGTVKEVLEEKLRRAEPQQGTSIAQVGFGGDTLKLQVKAEKDTFLTGEEAKFRIIVNNHTSRALKSGTIALHQRLATTEHNQSREVLLASVIERPLAIYVNPASGFEAVFSLTIPSVSHRVKFVCCPSRVGRVVRLEHFVVVTVLLAGPLGFSSTDITVRLPIKILPGSPSPPPFAASVVGFDQCLDPHKGSVSASQLYDKTYTQYTILVKSAESTWRVQRRYSEFDALRQKLNEEFEGIPALPPKRPLAKVDPSFLVARQEALDDFLRRIVRHPDVGISQALMHFLGVETFASYSSHNSSTPTAASTTPDAILAPPVPVEPTRSPQEPPPVTAPAAAGGHDPA